MSGARSTLWMLAAAALTGGGCYPDPDDLRQAGHSGAGGCQGAACSTGNGGSPGSDGGIPQGVDTAAYANAICDRFQACAPTRLSIAFGSLAACQARFKIAADAVAALPDTGWTAANIAACATAQRAQLCPDFNDTKIPPACNLAGKRTTGQACRVSDQCASLRCVATAGQCGTCAPRGNAGASCLGDADCMFGLVCTEAGTCFAPLDLNRVCDPTSAPCRYSLSCRDGFCSNPGGAQTPCSDFADCDDRHGYVCHPSTFVCSLATASTTTCGLPASSGALQYCQASGLCSVSGSCIAAAADNRSCSLSAGPACTFPASCLNGACTLPLTTDCR